MKTLILIASVLFLNACATTPQQAQALVWYAQMHEQNKTTNLVHLHAGSVPGAQPTVKKVQVTHTVSPFAQDFSAGLWE